MTLTTPDLSHIAEPLRHLAVPIDSLTLDPANARKHGDRNMAAIRSSLAKFGQRAPIVAQRQGMVVRAGNGRLTAARQLGWTHIAAIVVDESDVEATAYAIADNRSGELAEWDEDALARLFESLPTDMQDVTGFTLADIDELLAEAETEPAQQQIQQVQEDEPPTEVEARTKPGDLWLLGDHRLLCGDCRDWEHVSRLVGGAKINLAITSPPYAKQRDYDEASGFKGIPADGYVDWFEAVQANVGQALADDGSWFVNIKEHCEDGERSLYVKELLLAHVRRWGWRWVDEFCWAHEGVPKAVERRFKNGWEPVFQFTKTRDHKFRPDAVRHETDDVPDWSGLPPNMEEVQQFGCTEGMRRKGVDSRRKASNYHGDGRECLKYEDGTEPPRKSGLAYPSNVLRVGKNREALGHPAAFPIKLPSFFIQAYTDKGDVVYDPFMGSGTTMVAAHGLGRRSVGMELSPKYCDIIVARWERLTGQKAVRG